MDEPASFSPVPGLAGWRAAHVPSTGSTNADLAAMAVDGRIDKGRVWLTAGQQSAGRGRRGRQWASPPGNLHASFMLVDPAPPEAIGQLPLVAALAARKAIAAVIGDAGPRVQIKWPNDILIDGAKCCGMLLETRALENGRLAVIGGFGINIASHPPDTPYPATHLKLVSEAVTPAALFQQLAEALDEMVGLWAGGAHLAEIRRRWLGHAYGIGRRLRINTSDQAIDGTFEDMEADGRLVLRLPDGTRKRLAAGDVFF